MKVYKWCTNDLMPFSILYQSTIEYQIQIFKDYLNVKMAALVHVATSFAVPFHSNFFVFY